MSNRDHLMGYAPAAQEDFAEDDGIWSWLFGSYPLGLPKRVMDEIERRQGCGGMREALLRTPILRINHEAMTARDIVGAHTLARRAVEHARPFAQMLGLDIESHLTERSDAGDHTRVVRAVQNLEPEPAAVEGGYPVDLEPYKRYVPPGQVNQAQVSQTQEGLLAVGAFGRTVEAQMQQAVESRLNRWDAEREARIANQYAQQMASAQQCQQYNQQLQPAPRYGDLQNCFVPNEAAQQLSFR